MIQDYRVQTPCGLIQGAEGKEEGVAVFKGIRYAKAGRWEYPGQVTHWEGVYDAGSFGACSFQPRAFYNEEEVPEKAFYYREFRKGETYTYSEDCFFLNIWAPVESRDAPVLFYIHGGGFKGGCGHEKHFSGEAYCKRGIILVTCNYRLGPLGFCCLPELETEAGHTGNYGLYDQLCALQWVYDNIAAFGGDPGRITIMGQSAGAMSVQQLCVSPLTRGLISGAVMLSGGGVSRLLAPRTARAAFSFWEELAGRLKAPDLQALREIGPERLFEEFARLGREKKNAMAFAGPVLDGTMLTQTAWAAAGAGHQLAIPYLCGSTSEDIMPPLIHKMARRWAGIQSEQGKCSSYAYFFCRQLPGDDNGAWHSSDLWYVFGTLANGWRPFTEWDYRLSEAMVDYFSHFIKTGNPNGPGLAQWLPVEKGQNKVMRFGDQDMHMGGVSLAGLVRTMVTRHSVGE